MTAGTAGPDGEGDGRPARPSGDGPPGLEFAADSGLLRRAVELVEGGPASPERVGREVLGLRHAPAGVVRRAVETLLGADARVTFEDGRWRLRRRGRRGRAALDGLDYVVVDVETTGLSPRRGHRVTEIAAVEVRGGRVAAEFSTLVDPGRPIPPRVAGITGITDAMVADAPAFRDVAGVVRGKLEGRVFVAHNVPFDWRFLSAEMRRAGGPLPRGPRLCTLRLARRALPGLASKSLDAVARHYGVEVRGRHRAGGDARATSSVLLRLLSEARRRGIGSWRGLERWLSGEAGSPGASAATPPGGPAAGDGERPGGDGRA